METKLCTTCAEQKPTSCFHKAKKEKDGLQYQCIDCSKQYHAKRYIEQKEKLKAQIKKYKIENKDKVEESALLWRKKNPDKVKQYQRASNLKQSFGISIKEYEHMAEKQNNLCAICGNPETFIHHRTNKPAKLSVDHCHTTSKVRQLLCKKCNSGIGLFNEDIGVMQNAIKYLETHNG